MPAAGELEGDHVPEALEQGPGPGREQGGREVGELEGPRALEPARAQIGGGASASTTPRRPPKRSGWVCVISTAETGRAPSVSLTTFSAAADVSRVISGSTSTQPVSPRITVILA